MDRSISDDQPAAIKTRRPRNVKWDGPDVTEWDDENWDLVAAGRASFARGFAPRPRPVVR